jgi:hypothetical protein
MGDKDKAYENLEMFVTDLQSPYRKTNIIRLKNDPLFDSIRHEDKFQQLVHEQEAKYQAEHERVRQWLEEHDML